MASATRALKIALGQNSQIRRETFKEVDLQGLTNRP